MKKTEVLKLLEELCQKLSIIVKYDRFFGKGGYCRVNEKSYFIINEMLSNPTKEEIFIKELKELNLDPELIPQKIKELIH